MLEHLWGNEQMWRELNSSVQAFSSFSGQPDIVGKVEEREEDGGGEEGRMGKRGFVGWNKEQFGGAHLSAG